MLREEEKIQASIVSYIETVAPTVLCYAVPNASRRTFGGNASNAVPGMRKGVFDLALVLPPGSGPAGSLGGHAAFIEVKTRSGVLSDDQKAFQSALIQMGVPYVVARSIDDVREAFFMWKVPTREHAP